MSFELISITIDLASSWANAFQFPSLVLCLILGMMKCKSDAWHQKEFNRFNLFF